MASFIDFQNKLIYCHVSKCAGTSFSSAYKLKASQEHLLIATPNLSLISRAKSKLMTYMNLPYNLKLYTKYKFENSSNSIELKRTFLKTADKFGTHIPLSSLISLVSEYLLLSPSEIYSNWSFLSIIRDPADRLLSYINYVKASRIHHLHRKFKNVSSLSCAVNIFNKYTDEMSLSSTLGEHPFEFKKCYLLNQSNLPAAIKIPLQDRMVSVEMPFIKHYDAVKASKVVIDMPTESALLNSIWVDDDLYYRRLYPQIKATEKVI